MRLLNRTQLAGEALARAAQTAVASGSAAASAGDRPRLALGKRFLS